MMKKIALSALCLLIAACSTEKNCYRENCFITETEMTADMQKIRSILLDYYRKISKKQLEYDLKFTQVSCKLFGKNNKQLNKEIDKLKKIYESEKQMKENIELYKNLKKSLKGLKLDYKQVILLTKELETDYAKLKKEEEEKFAPYRARALEIMKTINEQNQKQDNWAYAHIQDGLEFSTRFELLYKMRDIVYGNYNKFSSYTLLIDMLEGLIFDGTLVDSFLENHPPFKDKTFFIPFYYYINGFIPRITNMEVMFDTVREAATNDKISKQELSDLVDKTSRYLREMTSSIAIIQHDLTDNIDHDSWENSYRESKWNNFSKGNRYIITDLVDKNPKFEDFDRKIDKLATRIAYQTYYKVNIVRFLYKEWRDAYYSQVKELLANTVKLADRLHEMIKDEEITDSTPDKRRYEHRRNVENISNINEIAKIGVEKIISPADCYVDSQEEIKNSIRKSFLQTRDAYLKNLGK